MYQFVEIITMYKLNVLNKTQEKSFLDLGNLYAFQSPQKGKLNIQLIKQIH